MVNSMKPILSRLICLEYEAFMDDHYIFNNVIIAQEFMHNLCHASIYRSLMVIKLDMEQAYNCIRWQFLERAPSNFNFYPRWIRWVMAYIHSSFAILINGTPSEFFLLHDSTMTSYPLSSYLFIIYVNIFS